MAYHLTNSPVEFVIVRPEGEYNFTTDLFELEIEIESAVKEHSDPKDFIPKLQDWVFDKTGFRLTFSEAFMLFKRVREEFDAVKKNYGLESSADTTSNATPSS